MQRSFDDLGAPLREVTFCVVDVETTGGSPVTDDLTEVGAVKVRGGEVLGTFQSLVNPGRAIPPAITVLTGITDAMVVPAPRIGALLPSLVEFVAGAVLVGHNVRFDLAFLNTALERHGRPRLHNPWTDTHALARRLVRDEVPNCRLATLADRLRLDHRPSHRALDDALATTDLLHLLLERAAAWGVLGLDDLLALPRLGGHPLVGRLRLTSALPRSPGVYLFLDGREHVLYVGKATNLRQRVRSYFSGDERRKVGALLRSTRGIRHRVCTSTLEAGVLELRMIQHHQPPFNRLGRTRSPAYVRLTVDEAFARLTISKRPRPGTVELGPLTSAAQARLAIEAVQTVLPLRRCSQRLLPGTTPRSTPCVPAQLGVAACPCAGAVDGAAYAEAVRAASRGLTGEPHLLLDPLATRMRRLATERRFEEAALLRDRAAALAAAIRRVDRVQRLVEAGRLVITMVDGSGAEIDEGRLVRAWAADGRASARLFDPDAPAAADPFDETLCIAAWLDAEATRLRLDHCTGGLAAPRQPLPAFVPVRGSQVRRAA